MRNNFGASDFVLASMLDTKAARRVLSLSSSLSLLPHLLPLTLRVLEAGHAGRALCV